MVGALYRNFKQISSAGAPDVSVETETIGSQVFGRFVPAFWHRVGMTYEVYDMAQFNRNNQIAIQTDLIVTSNWIWTV